MKRSKSALDLDELTLAQELNLDKKEVAKDKYKTTDLIEIRSKFGFQVNKKLLNMILEKIGKKFNLKGKENGKNSKPKARY